MKIDDMPWFEKPDVRISKEGVDKLIDVLPGIIEYLRQVSPVNLSLKDVER